MDNLTEFEERIIRFNRLYRLPCNAVPTTDVGESVKERLQKFKTTLLKEIEEVDDIIKEIDSPSAKYHYKAIEDYQTYILTLIADWLADIQIYAASEMVKFGLPIEPIKKIVMASNFSKQGEDGNPIYDENGKVMKGPYYWKPEPAIETLIANLRATPNSEKESIQIGFDSM